MEPEKNREKIQQKMVLRKNDDEKRIPWKIIYQNIRRLVTTNSKEKVDFFKEYTEENEILIMNFTETWLDENKQEDMKIKGYQLFRGDRIGKNGGGTAIYVKELYEAQKVTEMSIDGVEMIAVYIEKLNILNIVIYRPPDTNIINFSKILDKLKEILSEVKVPEPTVLLTGDFNFSFIKWIREENGGCRWEEKYKSGATRDGRKQFEKLNEVMDRNSLVQIIEEPTREKNTLDLVYTNEVSMITQVEISKSEMSDHDLIELTTNIKNGKNQTRKMEKKENMSVPNFWQLNFHDENVNWEIINELVRRIPWEILFKDKDTETCTRMLLEILLKVCIKFIPIRKAKGNNNIPRERKRLFNRIKKLKRAKNKVKGRKKAQDLDKRIQEIEREILIHKRDESILKEIRVIQNMKEKPKMFFNYIKNQENRDVKIGPFKIQKEYIYDEKEICKCLVNQYNSQFSSNGTEKKLDNNIFSNVQDGDLADIQVNEDDIQDAIAKMNANSSAGPDGVPAKFLIKTKETTSLPLLIIMRKSLDEGKIPDILKLAHVTPIHKGGSKLKPEQYRPVSLTSHIMKVFERVVKTSIMKHLLQNGLINPGQHGFVPGKSTQTQLLEHFCDIYEAIAEGVRIDTVYLDFAKAFDKVNHNILIEKLVNHKIKGKLGIWIKEFLSNRKYKVVANGEMSEEQDVLSGVPQGTVLAAILFIIMISDIDKEVSRSVIRCFADDTRNSLKIRTEEDKKDMQRDLDMIYRWAEENKMEFNENKFEQMTCGRTSGIDIESYKTPSGNEIPHKNKVKDLGVVTSEDLQFRGHIDSVITSCKIKQGIILRKFVTRKEEPMMKMFKTYIRSKIDYCCLVWSPWCAKDIDKIERIQRNFTSKIEGLEKLDYHERLKKLNLYSLERRRERFMIISAWQQIEGVKENFLDFKETCTGRHRNIRSTRMPINKNNLIHYSPARKMERLFNILPPYLRRMTGVKTDTFKKELDKWLMKVPDTPKIDGYGASVAAETNSIWHQTRFITK